MTSTSNRAGACALSHLSSSETLEADLFLSDVTPRKSAARSVSLVWRRTLTPRGALTSASSIDCVVFRFFVNKPRFSLPTKTWQSSMYIPFIYCVIAENHWPDFTAGLSLLDSATTAAFSLQKSNEWRHRSWCHNILLVHDGTWVRWTVGGTWPEDWVEQTRVKSSREFRKFSSSVWAKVVMQTYRHTKVTSLVMRLKKSRKGGEPYPPGMRFNSSLGWSRGNGTKLPSSRPYHIGMHLVMLLQIYTSLLIKLHTKKLNKLGLKSVHAKRLISFL